MSTTDEVLKFANQFVPLLPPIEDVGGQSEDFWNLLQVNSPTILENLNDPLYIRNKFSTIKQILFEWIGASLLGTKDEEYLADYIVNHRDHPDIQTIFLINEFLFYKRPDAIEAFSKIILPSDQFNLVSSSIDDGNLRRFCFALLAYLRSPHNLRSLMMFENAERVGYQRFHLATTSLGIDDPGFIEDLMQDAEKKIEEGVTLEDVDVRVINNILEQNDTSAGNKQSVCFDVFLDESQNILSIFIFRSLRETAIREIEDTVFADEAELVVLRASDKMRSIDTHSSSGIGNVLATKIVSNLLDDQNLEFIPETITTKVQDLRKLIDALQNEADEKIQLKEIYLQTAPLDGTPKLIIRSGENQTLVRSLKDLTQRNLSLLGDLQDVKNIKIGFIVNIKNDSQKSYSFKVTMKHLGQNLYYLPYSTANIASKIRSDFEAHLGENYNVKVFPGKG